MSKCEHDRGRDGYVSLHMKECPYCRIAQLEAERRTHVPIVDCVYKHIDRMNDYCEQDTAEEIVDDFRLAVGAMLDADLMRLHPDMGANTPQPPEASNG